MKDKKKFEGKVIVLGAGSIGKQLGFKTIWDNAVSAASILPYDAENPSTWSDARRDQMRTAWDSAYPKFHEEAGKFPDVPLIFGTAGADPYKEDGSGSITTFNTPEGMSSEEYFMRNFVQVKNPDGSFSKPIFRDIDKLILFRPRIFGKTHAFNAMKNYGRLKAIKLKKKYNRGKNNPPL